MMLDWGNFFLKGTEGFLFLKNIPDILYCLDGKSWHKMFQLTSSHLLTFDLTTEVLWEQLLLENEATEIGYLVNTQMFLCYAVSINKYVIERFVKSHNDSTLETLDNGRGKAALTRTMHILLSCCNTQNPNKYKRHKPSALISAKFLTMHLLLPLQNAVLICHKWNTAYSMEARYFLAWLYNSSQKC